jgi:hypothetical protein
MMMDDLPTTGDHHVSDTYTSPFYVHLSVTMSRQRFVFLRSCCLCCSSVRVYTSSATGPWGQSHMEWTDWASFLCRIIPLHLYIDGDTIWGFIVPGGLVVGVGWWFVSCVSSDRAGLVAWHYPLAGCGWRDGTVAFRCICYGDLQDTRLSSFIFLYCHSLSLARIVEYPPFCSVYLRLLTCLFFPAPMLLFLIDRFSSLPFLEWYLLMEIDWFGFDAMRMIGMEINGKGIGGLEIRHISVTGSKTDLFCLP